MQANTLHGRWSFHDHPRRFISDPPGTATVGQRFTYVPKVWDPELCGACIVAPSVSGPVCVLPNPVRVP